MNVNHLRLWVYDRPGVLDRITGLFRRNGLSIRSITAGDTYEGVSQITITLDENAPLGRLPEYFDELSVIQHWERCRPDTHIIRELLLARLRSDQRHLLTDELTVIQEDGDHIFAKYVAEPDQIDRMTRTLRGHDVACVRTGALGLAKREGEI